MASSNAKLSISPRMNAESAETTSRRALGSLTMIRIEVNPSEFVGRNDFPNRLQLLQPLSRHWLLRLHHLHKRIEQVRRIVRARAGFGVILHAENRQVFMAETFHGAIVQIEMSNDPALGFERLLIDGKPVILA